MCVGEGRNGFSLTGGEFNYTAVVHYPDTKEQVNINMVAKVRMQ